MMAPIPTLKIHNWDKWQSYRKDRGQPPWIKLHRELMRKVEWVSLTDAQRGQLVAIWLLAADRDGCIPADPKLIKKLCHLDTEPDLQLFAELDFIECDASVTPRRRQRDQPEAETEAYKEETETEAETETEVKVASIDATVLHVLEACNEITERNLTPTEKRKKKVRARLKDGYTPEQLKNAMRGAHGDEFYRGKNSRGRRYDWPETVFKDDSAVDRHLEHYERLERGEASVRSLSKQQRRAMNKYEVIATAPLTSVDGDKK